MTMDTQGNFGEQEIINLLGKLKDSGPEYPSHMWSARRAAVLAGLAVPVVAAGGLMGIAWIAKLVKLIKAMALIDKIIFGVEVAAITGLTGYGAVTAYQYRYELQALIFPSSINTPFPTLAVPPTLAVGAGGAGAETGTPVGTATPTPTVTPLATWTGLPAVPPTSGPGVPTSGVISTIPPPPTNPPPPTEPPATKPGRRCGQDIICTPGPTNTPNPHNP